MTQTTLYDYTWWPTHIALSNRPPALNSWTYLNSSAEIGKTVTSHLFILSQWNIQQKLNNKKWNYKKSLHCPCETTRPDLVYGLQIGYRQNPNQRLKLVWKRFLALPRQTKTVTALTSEWPLANYRLVQVLNIYRSYIKDRNNTQKLMPVELKMQHGIWVVLLWQTSEHDWYFISDGIFCSACE